MAICATATALRNSASSETLSHEFTTGAYEQIRKLRGSQSRQSGAVLSLLDVRCSVDGVGLKKLPLLPSRHDPDTGKPIKGWVPA